jgi:molybdopterin converting factor small subunit
MSIQVKLPDYLQDKTDGKSLIDVTGHTLRECFVMLVHRYPALRGEIMDDQGMLLLKWLVFINDKLANASDELSTSVTEGDMVLLVPMVAGG